MPQQIFFRPREAWVGDIIPFEQDGEFTLFYLHEERADPKPGTPWHAVSTRDLVTFEDRGLAFEHGSDSDPDFNVYTGSIVRDGETHHLFSTGQNPRRLGADGLPLQLVMHATSTDGMRTWTRHPQHTFGAPHGYESGDWRDPFVFRDEEAGLWRMLIAARHTDGPERRRGVIAQCVSDDLVTWRIAEPFWDPRRYVAHECPDVFQWGEWWYLVYSEFSDAFTTRYRMARSLEGPWIAPEHDSIDGRAYYASKTAERDGRRFFFGWIASREGSRDDGAWQWAGTLSVLEARQNADGTLSFGFTPETRASFTESVPLTLAGTPAADAAVVIDAGDGYRALVSEQELPDAFHASVTLDIDAGTTECGLLLRSSADGDTSYVVRLEPKRGRMVFDRWPRRRTGAGQWEISGDVPFFVELERSCDLAPGAHLLEVIVDGDLCVVNLDGRTTLSTRLYDHPRGRLGVFAGEGAVTVRDLRVAVHVASTGPVETRHPQNQYA
ncbi:glycoside hydrolase family 32 protein [Herbiconiux sp.]|uniref:glycoside hydrolase family 32 protein n=1 Tax=Herbiconiux sp. TaxID=1871186 RepID=UPI0025B8187A|nr:glycoside hydrolase family 32 protein [Herbiconiux sp.]